MKKYFALLIAVLYILCAGCSGNESDTGVVIGTGIGSNADIYQGLDTLQEASPRVTTCRRCHGNGICSHCDGEGFRDGRRCSVCNGAGYCNACGGLGSLDVLEINGKDYTVCSSCHGDGTCGLCDGTGRIVHQLSTLGRIDGDCMLCHGSGNCIGCKGTGLVELKGF